MNFTIHNYGDYASANYGVHALRVDMRGLSLYYSYETVVAFCTPRTGLVVSENVWSPTTGKHLNWIDGGDKKARLPYSEFIKLLEDQLHSVGIGHG